MIARYLLPSVLLTSMAFGQSSWLQFNAGASESSSPLVQFNGKWDEFLTFDIELRGLLAETVTIDSQDYLRFSTSPGTVPDDSVGYPELPVVRRLVWIPDDSDITLDYSANCCEGIECLPVYPAPFDSLVSDSTCTPYIGEYFRQDSAAYASEEWYPDTLARLVGEFRLRDLRVGIVDVYPVQYLASEDSMRVWSDIEIALSYDTTASWPTCDLGCYEALVGDRLLGYKPEPPPWAPIPGRVSRPRDLEAGPGFVPDYVILVASGLDGWWVDTLAHHRADLDGFDVAIARTDSVLSQFSNVQAITPDIIRDFTEAMWDWGSAETKRPSYLLLIGDHEDPDSAQAGWFLPTRTFYRQALGFLYGNDSWYVYFGESRSDSVALADMMVGRLPARRTDNLQGMIQVIRDYEAASSFPAPDSLSWRRQITRLQGSPPIDSSDWVPTAAWTDSIRTWCGYNWDNVYCGDCAAGDYGDHSTMTSDDWDTCLSTYFTRGQQMAFYTDHGIPHCFSAGADWHDAPPMPYHLGLPDSTFGVWDVDSLPVGNQHHGYSFLICLCCGTGSFDHTVAQHYDSFDPKYCFNDNSEQPPLFDYPIDCLAERFLKNTEGGAIAVFASSGASAAGSQYSAIGSGLIEAVLCRGLTRVGDAMAFMRLLEFNILIFNCGLGRYNLLGDPAIDIGDRVKFRSRCDLIISPNDLQMNRYPTREVPEVGRPEMLMATVRNAGAVESGEFDAEMAVECGEYDTLLTASCEGLEPGEETTLEFRWRIPADLIPPLTLSLSTVADPEQETPDSWWANNDASAEFEVIDFYPNEPGWPIAVPGSVASVPALGDVDGDGDLEIVVQISHRWILCAEPDGEIRWISDDYELSLGAGVIQGSIAPALGSVCGDESPEVVVYTPDELLVLDGEDGDLLYSRHHGSGATPPWGPYPRTVVLADLVSEQGQPYQRDEIAYVLRDTLYVLRVQGDSLAALDREYVPGAAVSGDTNLQSWVCARNLDRSYPAELIITCSHNKILGADMESRLHLYSFTGGAIYASKTFSSEFFRAIPAIGTLAGSSLKIALPRGYAESDHCPAYILDADSLQNTPINCASSDTTSAWVLSCMIADWTSASGTDRMAAPSANRAFSWEPDGDRNWFSLVEASVDRPPFAALGDLDATTYADMIFASRAGLVRALNGTGASLTGLGFPYTLPSDVYGGFAIADIDNDERVEVVFGTADNYLHVWQLGSCEEGYSPWPQCQHDAARTGALE